MDREEAWASMMRAARGGDGAAYERLLSEVATALRPVLRRRLDRLGAAGIDAEDVVQEVLVSLHCKGHTWDETRPILPWIHAVARHKALDAARRSGRDRRAVADLDLADLADRLPAPAAERVHPPDLERLLGRLPERQRGVVAALAIEGRSVAAVARRLGVAPGAVRVAFHRGLEALRRMAG